MANRAIKVEGLETLRRSFVAADKAVESDLKDALQEAAQPVRRDAQALAPMIRNVRVGDPWSRMRIGSVRTMVYVAPVEKGTRSRGNPRRGRRKFKELMLQRALEPALERNITQITRRVDEMLGDVAKVWERTV